MRWLELDQLAKRAILAFVLIILVLFAMALVGYLSGGWETPP